MTNSEAKSPITIIVVTKPDCDKIDATIVLFLAGRFEQAMSFYCG
jgi:hypothetical protein